MVHFSRAALLFVETCYAAVSSLALAATTTTSNATAPTPMVVESNRTTANTTTQTTENAANIQLVFENVCRIAFTYWEHEIGATFDINFVHPTGVDSTTEWFHDDPMPIETSNVEQFSGRLQLVQIWPRYQSVCISKIELECGEWTTGYAEARTVVITADAIQESWIRKTNGDRKTVNWDHGPCLYFRNDAWDKGAFRALDIRPKIFECGGGSNYMCVAGHLETFGN